MERDRREDLEAGAAAAVPQALPHQLEGTSAGGVIGDGARVATQLSERQGRRRGMAEASKFLGRLSLLEDTDLRVPIEHWRRAVTMSSSAWFAAESALAQAMRTSGRHEEQEVLLAQLVETLRYAGWFRRTRAVEKIGASEASVQYTTTLAMLGLLLRDRLAATDFATLYGPFAPLIPVAELGPE